MASQGRTFNVPGRGATASGGHLIILRALVDHRVVEELVDVSRPTGIIFSRTRLPVVITAAAPDSRAGDERFRRPVFWRPPILPNVFRGLAVPDILLGGTIPPLSGSTGSP